MPHIRPLIDKRNPWAALIAIAAAWVGCSGQVTSPDSGRRSDNGPDLGSTADTHGSDSPHVRPDGALAAAMSHEHLLLTLRRTSGGFAQIGATVVAQPLPKSRSRRWRTAAWRFVATDPGGHLVHQGGLADPTILRVPPGARGPDRHPPVIPVAGATFTIRVPTDTQRIGFFARQPASAASIDIVEAGYRVIGAVDVQHHAVTLP